MQLLPAIDILEGKAVRLAKGDYNAVTVYNDSPIDQAKAFEEMGAEWIHVVDLDGARSGNPSNHRGHPRENDAQGRDGRRHPYHGHPPTHLGCRRESRRAGHFAHLQSRLHP